MAQPNYSPMSYGVSHTDNDTGITYLYMPPGQWVPVSSGAKQAPMSYAPVTAQSSGGGGNSGGGGKPSNYSDLVAQYPGYAGWGETEAMADFAKTGGEGKGGGGSPGGGGYGDFVDTFSQLAASPIVLPPLDVKSIEEYEAQALEELKPYYERILKEEGGDVEKAKTRIEADYQRGLRYNREDAQLSQGELGNAIAPGESIQNYYNRAKNQYGVFPTEGTQLLGNLNKRGVLHSGIAKADTEKLASSQRRRQEAIDRALGRYEEGAGIEKARNIEDIASEWERRQFELGEEKKTKAGTLGRQKRSDDIATQEIERENIMRKAVQNWYG